MNTAKLWVSLARILTACTVLALSGCSSSGSDGPDCRYNADWLNGRCSVDFNFDFPAIADGIWRGTDASGQPVVALISRISEMQYIDGNGRVGSGFLAVDTNDSVGSGFQLISQRGNPFADGSTVADCTFSGSLIERSRLMVTEDCTTTAGTQFVENLNLVFDALYEQISALSTIAGLFETPTGDILDIAADGVFFSQIAASGCVINGQVTIIVGAANLYRYQYNMNNCTGKDLLFNGSVFSGFAILDNGASPEVLLFAVTGDVSGSPEAVVAGNNRL